MTCKLSEASRFRLAHDQIRPDSRKGAKYSIKIWGPPTSPFSNWFVIYLEIKQLAVFIDERESPEWIIRVFEKLCRARDHLSGVFALLSARYWANEQCSCEFSFEIRGKYEVVYNQETMSYVIVSCSQLSQCFFFGIPEHKKLSI